MTTRMARIASLMLSAMCYAQDQNQTTPPQPPPSKEASKKGPAKASKEFGATRIARDDAGYIESAFIQSLVRFRFDDGFDDRNIDLARYFYSVGLANNIAKLNFREYHFKLEYAFARRFSAFVDTPIRTLAPKVSYLCAPECNAQTQLQTLAPVANAWFTGLSDLHAGFKVGLLNRPNLQATFQLSTSIPTGDTKKGLGTGHSTIEPYFLYAQRLSDQFEIFGEVGDTHPFDSAKSVIFDPSRSVTEQTFAADVVNYGLGASYGVLQHSRVRITPVLEFVAWKVTGGLATIVAPGPVGLPVAYVVPPGASPAFGSNIVNVKAGWRTSWGEHNSIYTGLGIQVSHAGWYHKLLRIEYRYVFRKLQ